MVGDGGGTNETDLKASPEEPQGPPNGVDYQEGAKVSEPV